MLPGRRRVGPNEGPSPGQRASWASVGIRLTNSCRACADSIFYDADTSILFATFRYVGYDYAGDMERMRENDRVREWWALTDGLQESMVPGATSSASGDPPWWKPVEEVFHLP